jgi:hypothetical protein
MSRACTRMQLLPVCHSCAWRAVLSACKACVILWLLPAAAGTVAALGGVSVGPLQQDSQHRVAT